MLRIYFGDMPEAIYNTAVYFKNVYRDEWFEDEFAQQMIKAVDRATVLGPRAIESFALGVIPPTELSGGTKTLLLMYFEPEKVFNASTCGDNCARWILEIAKRHERQGRDLTVNLHHIMDFGGRRFTAEVVNTGEVVHSMKELVVPAIRSLHGDVR